MAEQETIEWEGMKVKLAGRTSDRKIAGDTVYGQSVEVVAKIPDTDELHHSIERCSNINGIIRTIEMLIERYSSDYQKVHEELWGLLREISPEVRARSRASELSFDFIALTVNRKLTASEEFRLRRWLAEQKEPHSPTPS